jgi:hypothetical protein
MEFAGQVERMKAWRNAHKSLVAKRIKGRQLARPSCRWDDNLKIYLKNMM